MQRDPAEETQVERHGRGEHAQPELAPDPENAELEHESEKCGKISRETPNETRRGAGKRVGYSFGNMNTKRAPSL